MGKRTPLYNEHLRLGARMVEFAGWEMPVQFKGVNEEHRCVRENVGLFDVSHMGEIRVRGAKALETLQWLTTNDVSRLEPGQAQYSLFPNREGGIVDDLIVYCLVKNQDYLLCVNAANIEKDFAFLQKENLGAELVNESESWGQIAVQGPKALELLSLVLSSEVGLMPSFTFQKFQILGTEVLFARTGYTGEEGGEIFVRAEKAVELWQTLLREGERFGVQPIGLAARDTLRTEMKYSLYGNDIDDGSDAYGAGLGWVVKAQQKDFLGKAQMLAKKEQAGAKRLVGFELLDKGIPRNGYRVYSHDGSEIGWVSSGTMSPTLGIPIGFAWVQKPWDKIGSEIAIDIRGRHAKAKVVQTPFVKTTSLQKKT